MAFFSDDVDEALQYAKHPPTIIYVFHPSEVLKVVDMTTLNNINIFETISKSCQIPPVFISQFASTNAAANKNVEDDFFNMMQAVGEIHGFYRTTHSSTLGKVAGEYDIYRKFVPPHIK